MWHCHFNRPCHSFYMAFLTNRYLNDLMKIQRLKYVKNGNNNGSGC